MDFPLTLFVCSFIVLWGAARLGVLLRIKSRSVRETDFQDLDFVAGAVLTLLGLLIGFSFSMAINRYDRRKNCEEQEANSISTAYTRLDFLPDQEAAAIQQLMKGYVDQRIMFYRARNINGVDRINADTARLQKEMWSKVKTAAGANPNPVTALVVSGMSDVLTAQGYTQAAWWNRIPSAAWGLMFLIAFGCSFLIGYAVRRSGGVIFLVIPLAVSISFLLIADMDSPYGGLINVTPRNLVSLSQSLQSR